jgi:type IV pilus assembly protein PilV
MITMHKKILEQKNNNSRGFSLLEVLLGITVFMIGMLGITALNISSLKSNTFSGNMSEAVILAGDKIEELMASDFTLDVIDTDGDGTNQDPTGVGSDTVGGGNFGLDDTGADADDSDTNVGKNGIYTVYWNVAVGEPMPEKTKQVNVIVEWSIKDVKRAMNMSTTILDHD